MENKKINRKISIFLIVAVFIIINLNLNLTSADDPSYQNCNNGQGVYVYENPEISGCDINCDNCSIQQDWCCDHHCDYKECNFGNCKKVDLGNRTCEGPSDTRYLDLPYARSSTFLTPKINKGYSYDHGCDTAYVSAWDSGFRKCVEIVSGGGVKAVYNGFFLGDSCSGSDDTVSLSSTEFNKNANKRGFCGGYCQPSYTFHCSDPGGPKTVSRCEQEGAKCYKGWKDTNKNGYTEETQGKCLAGECIVPVTITSVKLELDKSYLNSYINKDMYDEEVTIQYNPGDEFPDCNVPGDCCVNSGDCPGYVPFMCVSGKCISGPLFCESDEDCPGELFCPDDYPGDLFFDKYCISSKTFPIATKKDRWICNVTVAIPRYSVAEYYGDPNPVPGVPSEHPALEQMSIEMRIQGSHNGIDYQRAGADKEFNLAKDCDIDDENSRAYCTEIINAAGYEGNTIRCGAKSIEKGDDEFEFAQEFVISKYNYYFAPIRTPVLGVIIDPGYGDINQKYDYYQALADLNDKVPFVGKRIFLNSLYLNLSKECCMKDNGNTISFWTLAGTCEKKHGGYVAPELACDMLGSSYGKYAVDTDEYIKKSIKGKLGEDFIPDSIIIAILPNRIAYRICQLKDFDIPTAGIRSFDDDEIIIFSDFEGSRPAALAHEMAHRIGDACDEYSLEEWTRESNMLARGCPTPVGERGEVRFPKCCMLEDSGGVTGSAIGSGSEYAPCMAADGSCIGMPFRTKDRGGGENPFDHSIVSQSEIDIKSIMGKEYIEPNVYPENLPCPLINCY